MEQKRIPLNDIYSGVYTKVTSRTYDNMDSKYRALKKNDTTGYLKKKKKEQWQILTQAPPPGDLTYKGFFFL